jgi:uncharacterized glyoxalase superfamily protein PhnB
MSQAQPVPPAMTGVIPHLTVQNAAAAIEYYKKAFGATEIQRHAAPDGSIMHATIQIGQGMLMLNDEFKDFGCLAPPSLSGTPVFLMMYVPDVDATFQRAIDAGAQVKMPVADQFWGDRYGLLIDPFGHTWEIATHKEDLTKEELDRRGREAMAQMGQK